MKQYCDNVNKFIKDLDIYVGDSQNDIKIGRGFIKKWDGQTKRNYIDFHSYSELHDLVKDMVKHEFYSIPDHFWKKYKFCKRHVKIKYTDETPHECCCSTVETPIKYMLFSDLEDHQKTCKAFENCSGYDCGKCTHAHWKFYDAGGYPLDYVYGDVPF